MWVLLMKDSAWPVNEWQGMTPVCAELWETDSDDERNRRMWTNRPDDMNRWDSRQRADAVARKLRATRPPKGCVQGRRWIRVVSFEDLPAYLVGNLMLNV